MGEMNQNTSFGVNRKNIQVHGRKSETPLSLKLEAVIYLLSFGFNYYLASYLII